MHVVELLRRPRFEQAIGQIVVAVADHARDAPVEHSTLLYVGEQAPAQIMRVTPIVVVRVDAHDRIKKVMLKWQPLRGIRFNRMNGVAGNTE